MLATSRSIRITSVLNHENYNWIDTVPFLPNRLIKNVKFSDLPQFVEKRPDLAQDVTDRLMPLLKTIFFSLMNKVGNEVFFDGIE